MSKEDAAILMAFNAVSDQLKMVAAQDDTAATATDETTETED